MKKRTALGLVRVSTDSQDCARQFADLERVKLTHDLNIERTLELAGTSGREVLGHHDVQILLAELKRPDIAGVACAALDRLFRPDNYSDFQILDSFKATRKLIFSAKEGVLDPASDAGFMVSLMSGAMAGIEWRTLRQRTRDGKAEKRLLGRNVDGSKAIPKGLLYQRITDAAGRTIDGKWMYDEQEKAKVAKAYELLLQDRLSLNQIERRVGWERGRMRTLANPVWRGFRAYSANGDREAFEVPLPLEPLLSTDQWLRAQTLLAKRRTWNKERQDPRFLAAGLLLCKCERKYYLHSDTRPGQHDTYFCASRHSGKPGCGSPRLRRPTVDAAITRVVEEHLTNARFLSSVFRQLQKAAPQQHTQAGRETELAKLAARRQKWIEQYDADRITKQEFEARIDAVEKAVRELQARTPVAPPPVPDFRAVAEALVNRLASFRTMPFAEQRGTLQRIVRGFQVVDDTIPEITLAGSFLGNFQYTNSAQRSRPRRMPWRSDLFGRNQ